MTNVHLNPEKHYHMDDGQVVDAMAECDERDQQLIAVFHSHLRTPAIPSEADTGALNQDPAYLIVSLAEEMPKVRAWRMDSEYIGQPRATEVLIHVADENHPFTSEPPQVPWALTEGNKLLLTYYRPGHGGLRTVRTTVDSWALEAGTEKVVLTLQPSLGTDPKTMLMERVRAVKVVAESPRAARIAQRAALYARALAHAIEHDRTTEVRNYIRFLAAVYPDWLT